MKQGRLPERLIVSVHACVWEGRSTKFAWPYARGMQDPGTQHLYSNVNCLQTLLQRLVYFNLKTLTDFACRRRSAPLTSFPHHLRGGHSPSIFAGGERFETYIHTCKYRHSPSIFAGAERFETYLHKCKYRRARSIFGADTLEMSLLTNHRALCPGTFPSSSLVPCPRAALD